MEVRLLAVLFDFRRLFHY